MPLYEYECEACSRRFESIQKFSDPPLECCPTCGGAVHKLQSAPAFQFKGTGWYVTDYAKKEQPTAGKGDSGATESKESVKEGGASEKSDTSAKTEKAEKAEKTEKTDTAPKSDKSEGSSPKKTEN